MFDENANPHVKSTPVPMDQNHIDLSDLEMEMVDCPFCDGVFAVDATYLDQVTNVVHCPMCCMEVIIEEPDGQLGDPCLRG